MRIMLAIIALALLGWTGWWFAIAAAKEAALTAWLAERRAAGWVAESAGIDVAGFPYRVDTTVRGLELANPDLGWAWSAPEFQFLTLAYQPNHLIAIWPPEQTFATPLGATLIRADTFRASLKVEPALNLALDEATFELAGLTLTGAHAAPISMDKALLSTRQAASGAPFAHDIAFTAEGLALPTDLTRGLATGDQSLRIDATTQFDRPWDRPAIEGAPPLLQALDIRDFTFTAGPLDLRGKGALLADADGYAQGRLDIRARNWVAMVDMAEQTGALSSSVASAVRSGLGLLASLAGDRNSIETTLDLDGGRVFLGPIPIGPAPRFWSPAP